ncbi:hypothetical protein CDIK_2400 [Cucumispora dikerogammari]|nr:hypothetical protein CDIK_2400 [Cucumispora dikerogammari]
MCNWVQSSSKNNENKFPDTVLFDITLENKSPVFEIHYISVTDLSRTVGTCVFTRVPMYDLPSDLDICRLKKDSSINNMLFPPKLCSLYHKQISFFTLMVCSLFTLSSSWCVFSMLF